MRQRIHRTPAALAALLLAGLTALAGGAAAPAQASPTASGEAGSLLVILDVSGSMGRTDASGTTLMQGARQAVAALVDGVPDETPVGLRLYGSDYPGNNERQGCTDTRVAVPIAEAGTNGAKITAAMRGLKPTGFTPIGAALTAAADDFGPEGERTIVLVSDGEDTCGNPEPCRAARQLQRQGIDVRIDTVGLFLEGNRAARRQLSCIADATGGTFVTADDAAELTTELTAASTRAVRRYETAGTPIEGGTAQTTAVDIEPGTTYTDDITGGEARWYRFEAEEGQEVTVALTEDGSASYGCCLKLRLLGPDANQIHFDNAFNRTGIAQTLNVRSGRSPLRDSGAHYVSVELDADDVDGAIPFDLVVEVTGEPATEEPAEEPTEEATAEPTDEPTAEPAAERTGAADASDSGVPGWLYAVIGVLAVAVLGLGVAVVVLLRRPRTG